MKTLYLLRHAKSSWKDETLADRDRQLSGRGRKASTRMAEHMGDAGVAPALVLCSPALRTRDTLERVLPGLGGNPRVEIEEELYGAGAAELVARLNRVEESVAAVMLIGHNPGLELLALSLAATGERLDELRAKFPTGALATLAVPGSWAELAPGGAELTAFVIPRELD